MSCHWLSQQKSLAGLNRLLAHTAGPNGRRFRHFWQGKALTYAVPVLSNKSDWASRIVKRLAALKPIKMKNG